MLIIVATTFPFHRRNSSAASTFLTAEISAQQVRFKQLDTRSLTATILYNYIYEKYRTSLLYLALDNGQFEMAGQLLYGAFQAQVSSFRGMPEAMDLASGVTSERLVQIREEAKSAVLGDALNFPMPHIAGIRPQIDLGDAFRGNFQSDTPLLLISSTLDGRTYPEASAEQLKSFPNGQRLIVENGGHNIFEADERVADAVVSFFKGEPIPGRITMDAPSFSTP